MNRRIFLRTLTGTLFTTAVAPPVIRVFAPPGGWTLGADNVYTLYGGSRCSGRAWAAPRLRYLTLAEVERNLERYFGSAGGLTFYPAQPGLLDASVVKKLNAARNDEWFM